VPRINLKTKVKGTIDISCQDDEIMNKALQMQTRDKNSGWKWELFQGAACPAFRFFPAVAVAYLCFRPSTTNSSIT
jgi:hypothetical protein